MIKIESIDLQQQLIEKSKESFLLAVEIYNKPTIKYRIEGFSFFFVNAFELLLKAIILSNKKRVGAIYYKNGRTYSLKKCLDQVLVGKKNIGIKTNIEHIAEIRDQATHLIIPELEKIYAGLFQQGVINYIDLLEESFNEKVGFSQKMFSLVFDFAPEDFNVIKLQNKYDQNTLKHFKIEQTKILKKIESLDSKYSIPINYKIALVKNPSNADIVIGIDQDAKDKGTLIEVAKDSSVTHPYLTNNLTKIISDEINGKFTQHQLLAIKHFENIDHIKRPDFEYRNKAFSYPSPQYSNSFKTFILNKLKNDNYLQKALESYKQRKLS